MPFNFLYMLFEACGEFCCGRAFISQRNCFAIFFAKSFHIFSLFFLCNFIFELSVISELCFEPVVDIGNLFIRIIWVEWMEMTTAKCGSYAVVCVEYYFSWKHILIAMSSSNFHWKILTRYLMVTIFGLQFNFDWHLLFSLFHHNFQEDLLMRWDCLSRSLFLIRLMISNVQ